MEFAKEIQHIQYQIHHTPLLTNILSPFENFSGKKDQENNEKLKNLLRREVIYPSLHLGPLTLPCS